MQWCFSFFALETIVEKLVNNYAFTNLSDNNGLSPLHVACSKGHVSVAKFLMGRNVDINQKSKEGKTPLHIPSEKGYDDMALALLKHLSHKHC
jgi:ankyrin repeat protein